MPDPMHRDDMSRGDAMRAGQARRQDFLDETDRVFLEEQASLKNILIRICLVMLAAITLAWIAAAGTAVYYIWEILISEMADEKKQEIILFLVRMIGWLSILWAALSFALASVSFVLYNRGRREARRENGAGANSSDPAFASEEEDFAIFPETALHDPPGDADQEDSAPRGSGLPGRPDI